MTSKNTPELVGVVNFGGTATTCAEINRPSVFLRVSEYAGWIDKTKEKILTELGLSKSSKRSKKQKKFLGFFESKPEQNMLPLALLEIRDNAYKGYLNAMENNWFTKSPIVQAPGVKKE